MTVGIVETLSERLSLLNSPYEDWNCDMKLSCLVLDKEFYDGIIHNQILTSTFQETSLFLHENAPRGNYVIVIDPSQYSPSSNSWDNLFR